MMKFVHIGQRMLVWSVILVSLVSVWGCSRTITDESVVNVRTPVVAEWVKANTGKRLIMDVRDPSDFEDGHIPGAKNIRLQDVAAERKSPDYSAYATIAVYGRDGGSARAKAMVKRLLNVGYKDVVLLEDGYAGWLSVGGAVSRGR